MPDDRLPFWDIAHALAALHEAAAEEDRHSEPLLADELHDLDNGQVNRRIGVVLGWTNVAEHWSGYSVGIHPDGGYHTLPRWASDTDRALDLTADFQAITFRRDGADYVVQAEHRLIRVDVTAPSLARALCEAYLTVVELEKITANRSFPRP